MKISKNLPSPILFNFSDENPIFYSIRVLKIIQMTKAILIYLLQNAAF